MRCFASSRRSLLATLFSLPPDLGPEFVHNIFTASDSAANAAPETMLRQVWVVLRPTSATVFDLAQSSSNAGTYLVRKIPAIWNAKPKALRGFPTVCLGFDHDRERRAARSAWRRVEPNQLVVAPAIRPLA
jgi:hypothetical protein